VENVFTACARCLYYESDINVNNNIYLIGKCYRDQGNPTHAPKLRRRPPPDRGRLARFDHNHAP
jgi:hypothetical protein